MPTRLYVGNMDPASPPEKEDLERTFSKYGSVVNVWVARKPAGYAFVTYDSYRDALKAVDGLDGKNFQGRAMNIQLSMSKGAGKGEPDGGAGGGSAGGGNAGGGGSTRRRDGGYSSPPREREPSRRRRRRSSSSPRRSRSSPSYGRRRAPNTRRSRS
eukprot:TRINITY_DN70545_c0_g1_i1.p2 TRINITY_DN70545_c0_g1~~TRINITY_DN70545_c0_g1_i1.p2  ORF type:complete len:157 (+),score=13.95 TRINITY_DN70545_c0_g1_i1:231-701(+)